MARSKKGARAGPKAARQRAAAGSPRASNGRRNSPLKVLGNLLDGAHDFTLQDEARNTAHNHSSWDRDAKLRVRPVVFVSGGFIEPLKVLPIQNASPEPCFIQKTDPAEVVDDQLDQEPSLAPKVVQPTNTMVDSPPFAAPSPSLLKACQLMASTATEPFLIDAAGDQDLRGKSSHPSVTFPLRDFSDGESDSSEDVILFKGRENLRKDGTDEDISLGEIRNEIKAMETIMKKVPQQNDVIDLGAPQHSRPGYPPATLHLEVGDDGDDDAIIADYIANMLDDDLKDISHQNGLNSRDLGGTDDDFKLSESLEDTGDASGAEAESDVDSGSGDEAEHNLTSAEEHGGDGKLEEDGTQQEPLHMDDAQLASLLAKQEELGLGGDELLLFNGNFSPHSKDGPLLKQKKLTAYNFTTQAKKLMGRYPSARAVADAFDEFDLLDWDRPSLQNKTSNKQGKVLFGLSDSELEANLNATWQKDRLRKKEKKQAREELRAQSLLGKNANPDDPRVKYPTGVSLEDIKDELRSFLLGSDESLALPPMEANTRKIIHELANRFKIKSKSMGSGDQRRPVLYRTKFTVKYGDSRFEDVMVRVGRRYFPRLDHKTRGGRQGGGGRVNHAVVTMHDGEIVGGSAPEIAVTNKGRAMLEKMGWSSGMALGAMDNKGITQPIEHVVKRSKAGLG